jgi:hypothetical protein
LPDATTLILDPLLLSEGLVGARQTLTVKIFNLNQELIPGAAVTLVGTAADGSATSLSGVTDLDGQAIFQVLNLEQTVEYIALSGSVESSAIEVDPILE